MFTGIVAAVGRVADVTDGDGVRRLRIEADAGFLEGLRAGDSVAVDGACLTPVDVAADGFTVQAVTTTLGRTAAATYRPGSRVNLERALALGGRLDGHLVQGHVDGPGELIEVAEEGETRLMKVRIPADVFETTIPHGSIALNGVSLTVDRLEPPDTVRVAIIPHTWSHTNFPDLRPGDPINVEGDLIGKYVGRLVGRREPGASDHEGAPDNRHGHRSP